MADTPQPIIGRVLRWLNEHGSGTYPIGQINEDLPDLTRRQITSALHGLNSYGLTDRLENVGKGVWRYTPIDRVAHSDDGNTLISDDGTIRYDYRVSDGAVVEVPVGWQGTITVISKQRLGGGWTYLLRTGTGVILRAEMVHEMQTLTDTEPQ
jgi:hypothetical protein